MEIEESPRTQAARAKLYAVVKQTNIKGTGRVPRCCDCHWPKRPEWSDARGKNVWVHGPEPCRPCSGLDVCYWNSGHKEEVASRVIRNLELDAKRAEIKAKSKAAMSQNVMQVEAKMKAAINAKSRGANPASLQSVISLTRPAVTTVSANNVSKVSPHVSVSSSSSTSTTTDIGSTSDELAPARLSSMIAQLSGTASTTLASGATVPHLVRRAGTKRSAPSEESMALFASRVASSITNKTPLQQLFMTKV